MIELDSRPSRREDILAEQASDTQLLLNLSNGEYYALNEVGSDVWQLCDGSRSVREIVAAVGDEYDAPLDIIQADVLELLQGLANEGLVTTDR